MASSSTDHLFFITSIAILSISSFSLAAATSETYRVDLTDRKEPDLQGIVDISDSHREATSSYLKFPDVEVIYDKLFKYQIPRMGDMILHEVYLEDSGDIPAWMIWNKRTFLLEGIPTKETVGFKYFILVTFKSADVKSDKDSIVNKKKRDKFNISKITGRFAISVNQEIYGFLQKPLYDIPSHNLRTNVSFFVNGNDITRSVLNLTVDCTKPGTAVTKAIVVFDADAANFDVAKKISFIEGLAKTLSLDPQSVSLKSVVNMQILSASALVSGPGNVDVSRTNLRLVEMKETGENESAHSITIKEQTPEPVSLLSLQWVVGCGNVHSKQMDVLIKLEKTSDSGQLSARMGGLGVLAWYVVNNKPPRSKRSFGSRYSDTKHARAGSRKKQENKERLFEVEGVYSDIYAGSGDDNFRTDRDLSIAYSTATTTTTSKKTKKPKTRKPKTTTLSSPTEVFGPLDKLVLKVNKPFYQDLPRDRFPMHGAKEFTLSSRNSTSLLPNSWIKFNSTSFRVYGFPLQNDVGKHSFALTALTKTRMASANLEVEVLGLDKSVQNTHEFCMTLDTEFEKFVYDVESRINVASKLAKSFENLDSSDITIISIAKGSVVYTWYNSSMPQDRCADEELIRLMDRFVSSDGKISSNFKQHLFPYKLLSGTVLTFGPCSHIPSRPNEKVVVSLPDADVTRDKINSDSLFYMIVGFIVAAAIILVVIIVVVLLVCRKKRKKKQEKEMQLFKSGQPSKGVPVIFAEELQAAEKEEDKKSQRGDMPFSDTGRSTLRSRRGSEDGNICWDRRGVPPPEYQAPRAGSRDATLKRNEKTSGIDGSGINARSPFINNEDANSDDIKIPLNDEDNVDDYFNRINNFNRRTDPRIKQENYKNQQLIVSDID